MNILSGLDTLGCAEKGAKAVIGEPVFTREGNQHSQKQAF